MVATAARMVAGGGGGGGGAAEHARVQVVSRAQCDAQCVASAKERIRSWPAMRSSQGSDEAQDDAVAGEDVSAMVPVAATEHIASPTREVALGGQPTLCPGCHNHPSLRLPWQFLPEKVATGIEHFCDQLNSLYSRGIIDGALYNKLYEQAANRCPPTFYTIWTRHHCPPLWINYHNVKTTSGFLQIGCTRCMKMTPQLWIKGSANQINEIRHVLNWMLIIHELPGGASESSPVPPLPPACSTQRFVPLPPPPPPPAVGRSPPLSGGAGAAAEHAFVQPPPPPPACSRQAWSVERLVDPMKMSSLMQDKTDTELNSDGSFANIGHLPILDQPTGSLQIPSSPAPVPPPDGKLCIHRRHWANLERQPSELPAEESSYDLVD